MYKRGNKKLPIQWGEAKLYANEKLRLKSEFTRVSKEGVKYIGEYLLVIISKSTAKDNRLKFGIICGRKFSNKAVVRNRARRVVKEAFRRIKSQIKPVHIIFIPRKKIKNCSMHEVQNELINLLTKADLWNKSSNDL